MGLSTPDFQCHVAFLLIAGDATSERALAGRRARPGRWRCSGRRSTRAAALVSAHGGHARWPSEPHAIAGEGGRLFFCSYCRLSCLVVSWARSFPIILSSSSASFRLPLTAGRSPHRLQRRARRPARPREQRPDAYQTRRKKSPPAHRLA